MKMTLCKVLHFLGLDALWIRVLEWLAAALNKKLIAAKAKFHGFLGCCCQEDGD